MCYEILWIENNLLYGKIDSCTQGLVYFSATHCGPLVMVLDGGGRLVAIVLSKVCITAPNYHHCTFLGVYDIFMSNITPLMTLL